jgi:hypothetical protein
MVPQTYRIDVETFDTPAQRKGEGFDIQNHETTSTEVVGYRAARETAKTEAAKGKAGRVVILRGPLPSLRGRKV